MNNLLLIVIFSINFSFLCSGETDQYLTNIEKAFEVCHSKLQPEVAELFLKIHENEKAHPEFIQCVTAQDSFFYAYQVIAKELYLKVGAEPREDFEFLRFPTQELLQSKEAFFSKYPTFIISDEEQAKAFKTTPYKLEEALRLFEIQDEATYLGLSQGEKETRHDDEDEDEDTPSRYAFNDTHPEISKELLSVNFTMETYRPLDSSLFVFLTGGSVSISSSFTLNQMVYELFHSFSLPSEKVKACMDELIEKAPRTKYGIINQIFLPKDNISQFLYLSFGGGFLHSVYDSKFEESLHEFQVNRQEEDFRTFRNFQARIIAGSLLCDPRVKILRYTLIPDDQQRAYELIVREALDNLFQ
jgi:hypothetical protein